jgi:succinate dehydrogenase / fumarate reductase iron-sulfur subunit
MARTIRFSIFRYDPQKDKKPHYKDYQVELQRSGMMILDALNQIRWEQDGSLSFRRSCREGVCGSDGLNVNGVNLLGCMTKIEDLKQPIVVQPLPSMPIIKDLVVDMNDFYRKFFLVKPYLVTKTPPPSDRERLQSPEDRRKLDGLYECILCACCSTSCPSYWADPNYLGPAALLNAWRFIADSRDEGADERLQIINDRNGAWRCHTILNCVEACPKELNPTEAIAGIKKTIVQNKF